MALSEEHGMEKNFQKVNGIFRISTRPNKKCMTILAELKSLNSVTGRNANICVTDAKYSDCSCTEPRQQPLEGNGQETVRGEVIQETDLVGDDAEDVDADLQREPKCLIHNMPDHFDGTTTLMTSGEDPSVPMT